MDQQERDMKLVEDAVNVLIEHFDSVRIFCTRDDSSDVGTVNCNSGKGNWFAQYGQIKEWLLKKEQYAIEEVKRDFHEN